MTDVQHKNNLQKGLAEKKRGKTIIMKSYFSQLLKFWKIKFETFEPQI
jgi:hypothetical protein